jgi:hypothetical protein
MKVGILIDSTGNLGPTWGGLITELSKRTTRLLTLMMIATVGLHTGVAGTDAATANEIDEIKPFLLT